QILSCYIGRFTRITIPATPRRKAKRLHPFCVFKKSFSRLQETEAQQKAPPNQRGQSKPSILSVFGTRLAMLVWLLPFFQFFQRPLQRLDGLLVAGIRPQSLQRFLGLGHWV